MTVFLTFLLIVYFLSIIKWGLAMNSKQEQQLVEAIVEIKTILKEFLQTIKPVKPAKFFEIHTLIDGQYRRVEQMILQPGQDAALKLVILDAEKNPAKVEGDKVEWSLSGDAIGEFVAGADAFSGKFIANGAIGKCLLQAKADADLGEGVKELVAEQVFERLAGEAVFMEMSAEAVAKEVIPEPVPEIPVPEVAV